MFRINCPFNPWLITFPGGRYPPATIRITEDPFFWTMITYRWYRIYWQTRKLAPVRATIDERCVRLSRNGHAIQINPWAYRAEVR